MSDGYDTDLALARIKENQFGKGKSGNPSGRPKGSKNMKTIVQEIANERHAFTEDGVTEKLPVSELLLKILQRKACVGDLKAIKLLDKVREKFDATPAANEQIGYLVVPEQVDLNNTTLLIEQVE